jgi:hypothetical protein
MTKKRPGFHDLFAQIPLAVWDALSADAEAKGDSIARVLTEILRRHYKVPADKIPKPKRAGRKPRTPPAD